MSSSCSVSDLIKTLVIFHIYLIIFLTRTLFMFTFKCLSECDGRTAEPSVLHLYTFSAGALQTYDYMSWRFASSWGINMCNNLSCELISCVCSVDGALALLCYGKLKLNKDRLLLMKLMSSTAVVIVFHLCFCTLYGFWCFILFVIKSVVVGHSHL